MRTLRIERQDAQIEILSRRAKVRITTPPPKMILKTKPARMTVMRRTPQIRTNWSKVLRAPVSRPNVYVPVEIRQTESQPAHISEDKTAEGINVTISLAARIRATNVAPLRAEPTPIEQAQQIRTAALEWDMGGLEINWELSRVDVRWELSRPQVTVEPHSVEIKMKRYPKITISLNPEIEVRSVGRRFEKQI